MGSRSMVEQIALQRSNRELQYAQNERIGVIVVDNFPALGTLTALRFLEWVQTNPEGLISLPTGRTPEFFIKEVQRLLHGWQTANGCAELEAAGIDPAVKPHLNGLRFVQIDEFYPINPRHHNSFYHYVQKYYIDGFGMDPARALLINCEEIPLPGDAGLEEFWQDQPIDLELRYRNPRGRREELERQAIYHIDRWCIEYEDRIRALGGIGFFLGGIGPDGHIGFNVRGSSMYSPTRLTEVNYETQAAAASDLGGIEVARKRLVITIGLQTISFNPDCVAIIMAAGEAKAPVVQRAIESPRDIEVPATALHALPNARFYLTRGAACRLSRRRFIDFQERDPFEREDFERIVIDLSLERQKPIRDLTERDYRGDPLGRLALQRSKGGVKELNRSVIDSLVARIEAGMHNRSNTRFLHTEPHHDDIMLGYLPSVVRNIREHSNHHHFATMTSGFTAVTNAYVLSVCRKLQRTLQTRREPWRRLLGSGYFEDDRYRDHDVWIYLDGLAAVSTELQDEGTLRRFFRDLVTVFDELDIDDIEQRNNELINYFQTQYPGKKDLPYIQQLKGMCREWESACLWGYFGWDNRAVEHLRLGFYQGDIFTEEPTVNRDAVPVVDLLERVAPDVVTVAFDPEASGPDTHYKVMQAIAEGLRIYAERNGRDDLTIVGYRNIWYRFHPSEANVYVPVSLNMLTLQHSSFMHTYISQKDASFPSYEHDGPFPELAQRIQVRQYDMLQTCLGREYFYEHPSAMIRATRGFVFLREMDLAEFGRHSRELKRRAENR
ncbi:MAG: glucosamine-6-phosphate deaminase [Spirochaetaceae bacterium]|nr:MAG: glucosamine-6-phosphate deaminase [Spirochaetaceae bacterium]